MKQSVINLLKEPSTWAGVGLVIAAVLGMENGSGEQIGGIIAGIFAMVLPEKK